MIDFKKMMIIDEGLRSMPYLCTAGKITIGIGHNVEANPIPNRPLEYLRKHGLTLSEIDIVFKNDVEEVMKIFKKHFPWYNKISEVRRCALANMAFMLGETRFLKFKNMLAACEARKWEEASKECLNSLAARQNPARMARIAFMLRTDKIHPDYI